MKILVIAEQSRQAGAGRGKLNPASLEAIAAAQSLAGPEAEVYAVLLGDGSADAAAERLAQCRLAGVLRARHAALKEYSAETHTQALAEIIQRRRPDMVLLPHTYQTRDFAPRLATRLARGLISDVTALRREGNGVVASRPMFQGRLTADVAPVGGPPWLISVQVGAFRAEAAAAGDAPAPVEEESVTAEPPRVRAEAPFQEAKQAVDLTQAEIIVSAGRGIKEAKNLELVRRLADALGGELAASRPICDAGWLPMDRQVGSSGQTVAPKLYLAVGISGAIQHLVGMKGARSVAAINKDPEAPIFEISDYALIGDLFEIVPALIEAIQSAKSGG